MYFGLTNPLHYISLIQPGRERDIVLQVMRKFIEKQTSQRPLSIFSCFARDSLKGYIYVEAMQQAHVQEAIERMTGIYGSKLSLVPVKEMVDVLSVKKKDVPINLGSWVRIKRGKYSGDLGQVKTTRFFPLVFHRYCCCLLF